jgi:hypothetical protein
MKTKLFSCIVLSALLLASCTPNNPQPNPSPNTTTPTWKIVATINGVTHKAEGSSYILNSNHCITQIGGGIWLIDASIIDKSASSYISGDNGGLQFQLTNASLGINPLSNCTVYGSWFSDVTDFSGNGYSLTLNGPMVPNSIGGLGPKLPINLTSLGSAGNGQFVNSQPVKGNYSGTLYFKSSPTSVFDIPVTIDIDFEAMRP